MDLILRIEFTRKCPLLSSPSGEAAEDNVEEGENSEVKVTGYGRTDGRTERRGS